MAVTIYDLKPRFQARLRPLVAFLARVGVTANQITIGACLLSVGTGAWLSIDPTATARFLVLPVVLFVRMALNAIDGMLAREFGQRSRLGGFLNEITDVVSDVALLWPFCYRPGLPIVAPVVVMLLAAVSELTGVVGVAVGASRRYDGPMGKSDRAFVLGVLGLVIGLGHDAAGWLTYVFAAMSGLIVLNVINRVRAALAEAAAADRQRG